MIKTLSLVVLFIIFLILVALAYNNAAIVEFDYLLETVSLPLSFLLLFSFISGLIIASLSYLSVILALKIKLKRLRSAAKKVS